LIESCGPEGSFGINQSGFAKNGWQASTSWKKAAVGSQLVVYVPTKPIRLTFTTPPIPLGAGSTIGK
jgi:hypothetical protein